MSTCLEPIRGEELLFLPLAAVPWYFAGERLLVVIDPRLAEDFGPFFSDSPILIVPEGEKAKSWDSLSLLFEDFLRLGVDRSWKVLAVGGGTVSDLAGFAAHLWMRGLSFSCAPTTLLAMVDASLGGKNGIDFRGYKNALGSFQRPERIFCDVTVLSSLDPVQFASGIVEAVKHAVIDGESYFSFLEALLADGGGAEAFSHKACHPESLKKLVTESQRIKTGIVDADPLEKGGRRVLNLGHSFGHALELETGLPHGYAVSLGMALALRYSLSKGFISQGEASRVLRLLEGFGLPINLSILADGALRSRVASSLYMDKKREGAAMNFVLPRGIGRVEVAKVPVEELRRFLEEAWR
ncbi:MAG: 3-dehydroquinate synthase [Spirochaetes bacterium]|nr:3-dehydroquinate synthase [Spirochaetota bacterium]